MEQIEVAKGISDYGMMAVAAAFFLVISGGMLIIFIKWFVRVINSVLEESRETTKKLIQETQNQNKELLQETRSQNEKLQDIREGLIEETMTRIKVVSSFAYDLAVEETCRLVSRIKKENNIADEAATVAKIKRLLQIMHERRNSKFDSFRFRGQRLSSFTNGIWVEQVAEIVKHEVYADENSNRTYTNVTAVYDNIKLEFYHNLKML